MWYMYTMEYYSAIKSEIMSRDYYTKFSKFERHISYDISCMQNKKNDSNELMYKPKIDSQI